MGDPSAAPGGSPLYFACVPPEKTADREGIGGPAPIKRRELLKAGAVAGAAAALEGCVQREIVSGAATSRGPAIIGDTLEWTMVTTWPPNLPIFQEGVQMMADQIEVMSHGRLKISVYGGGELVPAFESFDAVMSGTAQMSHGASYYWAGKEPATQFFSGIPFGMNAQQMNAWLYAGGGLELWEEIYEPFGVVPFATGNSGPQMGGWFRKEINSIEDFSGLKMRMPGLGGRVISELRASAVLLPLGEIYTSLERGVIDATEWVGPYHDEIMGFQNVAKNYYYPGWHEPGTVLELAVNRNAWDGLSTDLQEIIRATATAQNTWMLSQFEARNHAALEKLVREDGVRLRQFPDDLLAALKRTSEVVIRDYVAADAKSSKVYDSFRAFQKKVGGWSRYSEQPFYNLVQELGA